MSEGAHRFADVNCGFLIHSEKREGDGFGGQRVLDGCRARRVLARHNLPKGGEGRRGGGPQSSGTHSRVCEGGEDGGREGGRGRAGLRAPRWSQATKRSGVKPPTSTCVPPRLAMMSPMRATLPLPNSMRPAVEKEKGARARDMPSGKTGGPQRFVCGAQALLWNCDECECRKRFGI